MSDYEPLVRRRDVDVEDLQPLDQQLVLESKKVDLPIHFHIPLSTTTTAAAISKSRTVRVASLDVFRGLSVLVSRRFFSLFFSSMISGILFFFVYVWFVLVNMFLHCCWNGFCFCLFQNSVLFIYLFFSS